MHRCGYCDFVTAVGRVDEHQAYVDALICELEHERRLLAPELETVFVGGGTPTFTEPHALARLLAALPGAREVTVEANPETITPEIARLLRAHGVNRISLGAQTFEQRLLEVLERSATSDDVRRAVHTLRDAGFDNISLDLIHGIPGQSAADLERDLTEALRLAPEHLSCYELEAKPGTRFTHTWGGELERQAAALEGYYERVIERLVGAGYRWYETANFSLDCEQAGGRDLRAHHNLGYWRAQDYLGLGVGAVSTLSRGPVVDPSVAATTDDGEAGVGAERRRNLPSVGKYVAALQAGEPPPRELEALEAQTRAVERLMLGLRLDEALGCAEIAAAVDAPALERLISGGLVERSATPDGADGIVLTPRGRRLGDGVTAELLAD